MSGHKKTAAESLPSPDQEKVENIETIILEDWSQYVQGKLVFFPIEKYENMEISDSIQYIFDTYESILDRLDLIESNDENNLDLEDVLEILAQLDESQDKFEGPNKMFLKKLINTTYSSFFIKFIIEPLCLANDSIEDFLLDVINDLSKYEDYLYNVIFKITYTIIQEIYSNIGNTPNYEINNNDHILYKISINIMYDIITSNSDIYDDDYSSQYMNIAIPTVNSYILKFENIYYSGWAIYTWNKILDGTFNEKSVFNYINTYYDEFETIPPEIDTLYQMITPHDFKDYSVKNLINNISTKNKNINIYMSSGFDHTYDDDLIYLTLRNIAKYEGKLIGTAWWIVSDIEPKAYPFGSDPTDRKLIQKHLKLLKFLLKKQDEGGDINNYETAKQIQSNINLLENRLKTY